MRRDFKIFSICVVKNEADVIGHSLNEAAKWSDRIFVFDNGSTDRTWELVQSMASNVVVPWKQDGRAFTDALRAEVFAQFRHEARDGDWWCRLDADEFYFADPHEFLADVPKRHHVVWGLAVEYYLTRNDVDRLDFTVPIERLLPEIHHYRAINSEARFFRYRRRLAWPTENASWPRHMGIVHPRRIPFRHYQYRTPEQIRRRLATRREAVERGTVMYWSEQDSNWESALADPDTCRRSENGSFLADEMRLPRHIEPPHRRLLKAALHGTGIWP